MQSRLSFATKAAAVTDTLRSEILSGVLPPGTALLQEEIAERLGISSTPVREAFAMLESEGLVHRRPHRGVVVALVQDVAPNEAEAIYRIRHLLEKDVLSRLASGSDSHLLDSLRQVIADGEGARKGRDYVRYRRSISEFHRVMARGTGSEFFTALLLMLSSRSQFFVTAMSRQGLRRSHEEHREILMAVEAGDVDAALAAEARHLEQNLVQANPNAPAHRADTTDAQ